MTGRGGWSNIGMPTSSVYYELLTPVFVGSQLELDDAHRAVNFGVRQIQARINELRAPYINPAAFITGAEHDKLSAAHQDQWQAYTTGGGAHGFAPKPGVVPFITGAEYNQLAPGNQGRFAPFTTDNGAHGWQPTALMVPKLVVDGVFAQRTSDWVKWAQRVLGLSMNGRVGPTMMQAMLWPYITNLAYTDEIEHAIGGITKHESGWDPGAVGFATPEDIGLVQINGPSNPTLSEAQRFDYHVAFAYCGDRLTRTREAYGRLDIAIADYYSPVWAQEWAKTGTSPNTLVSDFVDFVLTWTP